MKKNNEYKLYIDGEYIDSESNAWIEVENPATKEILAKVPRGNEKDTEKGILAAREAFPKWSETPLSVRIGYVEEFRDFLKEHREEIIRTIQSELGSARKFSEGAQFDGQLQRIDAFIAIARSYDFERTTDNYTIRKEPVGVVACITPWNFPLGQIIQKIIPALLAGNTIVLKPSQNTPVTAFYVADGFHKVGLPDGVFNLITGKGAEVGDVLAKHPEVDMVSFTGSTTGGTDVGSKAMGSVKRVSLELGGKSAAVFLDDSDLEKNIQTALSRIFNNTGQVCSAWSRLVVVSDAKKAVEAEIIKQLPNFSVGDPMDPEIFMGPLSSRKQFEKVSAYIEDGKSRLTVLAGDGKLDDSQGYFVSPIVFTDVDENDKLAQEEIFGPVLVIIEARDAADAVRIANNSLYGLSGGVFGQEDQAMEAARKIRTGSITVNTDRGDNTAPFGGYKQSGNSREGGMEGFEEFLETKTLVN